MRCRCPLVHFGDSFIEFFFRSFSEILWAFCRKYFGNAFKKLILFVQKTRLTKYLFSFKKKRNLLNVLWHLAKNCRPLAEKFFLRDCQNCNRSVHRRVLRIFLKNLYCYHPLELIEKKSVFYTNLSGTIVKTALQVFMGIFWGKSEKIFLFLQLLSALEWRKFAMYLNFLAQLSKMHSKFPESYSE